MREGAARWRSLGQAPYNVPASAATTILESTPNHPPLAVPVGAAKNQSQPSHTTRPKLTGK